MIKGYIVVLDNELFVSDTKTKTLTNNKEKAVILSSYSEVVECYDHFDYEMHDRLDCKEVSA